MHAGMLGASCCSPALAAAGLLGARPLAMHRQAYKK